MFSMLAFYIFFLCNDLMILHISLYIKVFMMFYTINVNKYLCLKLIFCSSSFSSILLGSVLKVWIIIISQCENIPFPVKTQKTMCEIELPIYIYFGLSSYIEKHRTRKKLVISNKLERDSKLVSTN